MLEVLNLDEKGKTTRELVNDSLLGEIKGKIAAAGQDLRGNRLPVFRAGAARATTAT
ncbi:MAG: hypothetical protein ACRDNS_20785 [Trebonia sp.]